MAAIEPCVNCHKAIENAADAVFHRGKWFCGHRCHNEYLLSAMAKHCPAKMVCIEDPK